MATTFSTRVLRTVYEGKKMIVDGGCGNGVQALYLARRNPQSIVCGYDISTAKIKEANEYKRNHGIPNAEFSVSSHDDFNPRFEADMVYTTDSLVGDHELSESNTTILRGAEEIVRKRFSKFRSFMSNDGVYVVTWGSTHSADKELTRIAEECGLKCLSSVFGDILNYTTNFGILRQSGIVFEKA